MLPEWNKGNKKFVASALLTWCDNENCIANAAKCSRVFQKQKKLEGLLPQSEHIYVRG